MPTFLFLSAMLLAASSAAPENAPADTGAKSDRDKLICRKDTATGSRLGARRICKTQSAWDSQAKGASKWVSDSQARASASSER